MHLIVLNNLVLCINTVHTTEINTIFNLFKSWLKPEICFSVNYVQYLDLMELHGKNDTIYSL